VTRKSKDRCWSCQGEVFDKENAPFLTTKRNGVVLFCSVQCIENYRFRTLKTHQTVMVGLTLTVPPSWKKAMTLICGKDKLFPSYSEFIRRAILNKIIREGKKLTQWPSNLPSLIQADDCEHILSFEKVIEAILDHPLKEVRANQLTERFQTSVGKISHFLGVMTKEGYLTKDKSDYYSVDSAHSQRVYRPTKKGLKYYEKAKGDVKS